MPAKPEIMEITRTAEEKRSRFGRWFARKAISYMVVCAFLTFVNWFSSPGYWWVAWVWAGWGLSLILSLAYYLVGCDDDRNYDNR